MWRISVLLVLFTLASIARGQDLSRRPEQFGVNDPSLPDKPHPLSVETILPATPIPPGMVWVPRGKVWHAEELGSCEWCGKPMTWKKAALDKKMTSLWLLEVGLTVADTELGQACIRSGRCKEGNPLLGTGGRGMQYGIRMPIIAGAWLGTAWLRKGNKEQHIGGMKHWWILPVIYHATATAGVISGLTQR